MHAEIRTSVPALAAVEPAVSPISVQAALLIILGIALVFTAKSLADLHRRVDALTVRSRPKKSQTPAAAVSPEMVAVISAAAFEAIGSDHRIVSIISDPQDNPSWSHEGRRQIFAGRKVR